MRLGGFDDVRTSGDTLIDKCCLKLVCLCRLPASLLLGFSIQAQQSISLPFNLPTQ